MTLADDHDDCVGVLYDDHHNNDVDVVDVDDYGWIHSPIELSGNAYSSKLGKLKIHRYYHQHS